MTVYVNIPYLQPLFSFIILHYLQWALVQSQRYGDEICPLTFAHFVGWLLEWNRSVLV